MEKTIESAEAAERQRSNPTRVRRALGSGLLRRVAPYAAPLALSSLLAYFSINAILEKAGRPALPLDDSFIHLQFARRFAEGHPFTFANGGGGFSSGATSFLWPLMLAPFYALGMHGLTLVYAVWGLGTVFHAGVILESKRLAEPLVGRPAAFGVAAMCLVFGAFTWFAWSGMETIPFTWALVRGARVTADYLELPKNARTFKAAGWVVAMAILAPLLRPEGGLTAVVATAALCYAGLPIFSSHRFEKVLSRLPAVVCLAGVVVIPALNVKLTGHARSTTAMVKWYVGNPYLEGTRLLQAITGNMKMLVTDLLAGGYYTQEFLPDWTLYALAAGVLGLSVAIVRPRTRARALVVSAFVLGSFIPCTFSTILWNRVRYIWPFAPSWFLLVACLGKGLTDLSGLFTKQLDFLAPLVAGAFAGALSTKLKGSIDDLATSARAINLQQVTLGMWAHDHLPADARIGVNDTGAIAYFSDRRTFDVVGLTTEGEAKYWVQGAGSRYEHYERMSPSELPTHFIVYPEWMDIYPILGQELTRATVTEQSILGGASKIAYEADYSVLGKGSLPLVHPSSDAPIDEVDVADLESEAAHQYWVGPSNSGENHVFTTLNDSDETVADGGRAARFYDGFFAVLPEGRPARMVMRLSTTEDMAVEITAADQHVSDVDVPASGWTEVETTIPAELASRRTVIRVTPKDDARRFTSMHYWFFASP